MIRFLVPLAVLACVLTGGCSIKAPAYHTSIDNVQTLQGFGPAKLSVGSVKADDKTGSNLDYISARGLQFESPYADGYAGYLREALRADLSAAGRFDAAAPRVIDAVLIANRLDASGINTAEAEIAARFSLTEGGRVLYQKEHAAKHRWDSSFLGALAAQHAMNNYGATMQKLIGRLFADPEFAAAARR